MSSGAAEPGTTLAARLGAARQGRFVGRQTEIDLFERALEAPGADFSVLFVHGPPGVGKSALLRELAARAADRGRRVALLDVRGVEHTPEGVLAALRAAGAEDLRAVDVLLLDTYELASALDGWVREQLVPSLPADALVVVAGRLPPAPEWTSDPGWRGLVRVLALRNLRREDAALILAREPVEPTERDRILDETLGHPLALCLYVDLVAQRRTAGATGPEPALLADPDVVRALLDRFVDEVPTRRHRAALELCAHVRVTTEEVLRAALDVNADEAARLFDWLRGLSFVDAARDGLLPHDLARDLLDADLRWRDAASYEALHLRVRRHFVARLRSNPGPDRHRAATDLVFLHRANPLMRHFWDFNGLSQGYLDRLRPGDGEVLRGLVLRHQGSESVTVLDHWLRRQPEAFAVFRLGADPAPFGFTALLALHETDDEDRAADPAVAAMWTDVRRRGAAPGEAAICCRYVVDRDAHHAPGTLTFGLSSVSHLQHMLTQPRRSVDFIAGISEPDLVDPVFSYLDFVRDPSLEVELDGRRWSVYVRDWRQRDVDTWFEMVAERELGAPVERLPLGAAPATMALSQPDFADAVRRALRDLHRAHELRHNPLTASRLVADAGGDDAATALAGVVRGAVAALAEDPRADKYARAVDRTFLRGAPTQERAAEVLGLPFSTYRRHLARGIELVAARLWDQELYGPADPHEQEVSTDRPGG